MAGKYVVIEGPDFVGKSTVAAKVEKWIRKSGRECVLVGLPGATSLGETIKSIVKAAVLHPTTEAMLFAADYNEFVNQRLRPTLAANKILISDRNNVISGLVYQTASGFSMESLIDIYSAINAPRIDLALILRADKDELLKRKLARNGPIDAFEGRESAYFNKVIDMYNEIDSILPSRFVSNVEFIDANQDEKAVLSDVIDQIKTLYEE